jgi:hypothetical protein
MAVLAPSRSAALSVLEQTDSNDWPVIVWVE